MLMAIADIAILWAIMTGTVFVVLAALYGAGWGLDWILDQTPPDWVIGLVIAIIIGALLAAAAYSDGVRLF